MAAKKYYAIAAGRQPGIYENWPDAQAQVAGFRGARFKGFPTRDEAETWMKSPTFTPAAGKRKSKTPSIPATADFSPKDGEVTIYTDGGARFNPGPGGYGIVIMDNGGKKELTGGFRMTTNNRMELMGCIEALRHLEFRDQPMTLYSDSSYVVNGIGKGWAKKWRRNGWIKSDKKPAMNADLWAALLDLTDGLDITFKWVKGHAGHPMNERCDKLAVASARRKGLPEDLGYTK